MPDENNKPESIETVDLRKNIEKIPQKEEADFELPDLPELFENGPEQIEVAIEKHEQQAEREGKSGPEITPGSIVQTGIADQKQKEKEKEIEKVLETGLEDAFLKMTPDKRREFASKGEETAKNINELFDKGKATAKKIIELIKKWLSLLPGVNRFFLEQEAKIKADEILKKRNQNN